MDTLSLAVRPGDLAIRPGEMLTLLGPRGRGQTATPRPRVDLERCPSGGERLQQSGSRVLGQVGLCGVAERAATQPSGGQQQQLLLSMRPDHVRMRRR